MEQSNDSEQVEVVAPQVSSEPSRPKSSHKRLIVLGSIAGFVCVLGVGAWVFREPMLNFFAGQLTTDVANTMEGQDAQDEITDPELQRFIVPTTGESWYSEPKPMAAQGWFRSELASSYTPYDGSSIADQMAENAPVYQEVGTRAGNTIVLVKDQLSGGLWPAYWLLEQRKDGDIAVIVKPQTGTYDAATMQQARDAVTAKVTVFDETTKYDSLSIPAQIPLANGEVVTRQTYATLVSAMYAGSETNDTLVKQLGASRLMRIETRYADTHLTNIGYYIVTPIGTKVSVDYQPNNESLERYTLPGATLQYKNYDGDMVYDTIAAIARGCGGATAAVTRSESLKLTDLTKVGTTDTGRAVYEITNKNHDLYVKGYQEYKDTYEASAASFDEYVTQRGLMVIQNASGELLVYVRGQYAMGGGCAKPVVYLYPTAPTTVSVRVGANVTVSDPHYPKGGWTNVLAQPDGTLTYRGAQYTSLFWEGTGYGTYPGISSGVVVKRANAVSTIRHQLLAQGLRGQEITDFLDFWADKLPTTPYIRLTWLTQAEIDTLASLNVTPKPQTVIRVFLDMGGLSKPILLQPQQLTAKPRFGFTVVEWGGLTALIK